MDKPETATAAMMVDDDNPQRVCVRHGWMRNGMEPHPEGRWILYADVVRIMERMVTDLQKAREPEDGCDG